MDGSALLEEARAKLVENPLFGANREVTYTRRSDSTVSTHRTLVGGGVFNKIEKETIGQFQSFAGIVLETPPVVGDTVQFGGIDWYVVRWGYFAGRYTVYAENRRHNGRPTPP